MSFSAFWAQHGREPARHLANMDFTPARQGSANRPSTREGVAEDVVRGIAEQAYHAGIEAASARQQSTMKLLKVFGTADPERARMQAEAMLEELQKLRGAK